MKLRLFFILLLAVQLFSLSAQTHYEKRKEKTKNPDEIEYRITGVWENGDGEIVYLKAKEESKTEESKTIDSVAVKNSAFALNGKAILDKYTLILKDQKKEVLLTGEPIQVTAVSEDKEVRGKVKTLTRVDLKGGKEQEIWDEASSILMGKDFVKFGLMFVIVQNKDDSLKVDSLARLMDTVDKEKDLEIREFIKNNIDSYAAAYMINSYITRDSPLSDVEYYYDLLPERIKKSNPGKLVMEKITSLKSVTENGFAAEIDLPSPDGTPVKLSSLRGKYVLLDFWASWCKPCLAELPNVKEIYNKYHDKGFEIYSVSLDDKKELWEKAIQKYEMNWWHVSSLKGWKCPIAARYNVTGVPKMYLLDPNGRIIAVDLRGEKLKEKVASFFLD